MYYIAELNAPLLQTRLIPRERKSRITFPLKENHSLSSTYIRYHSLHEPSIHHHSGNTFPVAAPIFTPPHYSREPFKLQGRKLLIITPLFDILLSFLLLKSEGWLRLDSPQTLHQDNSSISISIYVYIGIISQIRHS